MGRSFGCYAATIMDNWVYDTLQPHLSNKVYVTAPDLMLKNYLEKYYGNNLSRLVKIKNHYDPENIFSYTQSIPTSL